MITSVIPRLVLDGADRAIAFYQQALGAELLERFTGPGAWSSTPSSGWVSTASR